MVREASEIEVVRSLLARYQLKPAIYPTIETIEALANIDAIAKESSGLIFGSADLAAILGVDIEWENMLYARQRIVHAAALHNIPAIDTACYHLEDLGELREESQRVKSMGFRGKAAVHPSQIPIINELFTPTAQERQWWKERSRLRRGRVAVF